MKYKNNQNNMITLREKWELHKTGSFGSTKKRGSNFAMHSEFRYHSENFAMIAKFRYHSENLRHSENLNFRYAQ